METMELLEIGSDADNGYGYGQGSRMPEPSPDERSHIAGALAGAGSIF